MDPVLTHHARQRCDEMGISTKVAKRIYRDRTITYDGNPHATTRVAMSADPDYAVVYADGEPPVIVSVVFRTAVTYTRRGATYEETETR